MGRPLTGIVLNLTLPKLHLATLNNASTFTRFCCCLFGWLVGCLVKWFCCWCWCLFVVVVVVVVVVFFFLLITQMGTTLAVWFLVHLRTVPTNTEVSLRGL